MEARRNILVLDSEGSAWISFLMEFFQDSRCRVDIFHDASSAGRCLDQGAHEVVFLNPALLNLSLTQKVWAFYQSYPKFRCFQIGQMHGVDRRVLFNDCFEKLPASTEFGRRIMRHMPLPEKIRLLVVDDEKEIGAMIREFLGPQTNPAFEVRYAPNGQEGLFAIESERPDVLILDIKMPVKDGREVYREIKERNFKFPVIVFFDAVSGEEMLEIRKFGNPVVVEKGSHEGTMVEMMTLVKKLAYFG